MVHLRVGVGLKRTYCLTYQDVSYKKVTEEKTVNFIVIVSSSKEPSNILKAYLFMKPAKKILSLPWRKIVFEFWPLRQCWAVGQI